MNIKIVLSAALLLGVCSSEAFALSIKDCPHYTTSFSNGICYPSKVAPLAFLENNVATAETNLAAAKKAGAGKASTEAAALAAAKKQLVAGKAAYKEAAAKKKAEAAPAVVVVPNSYLMAAPNGHVNKIGSKCQICSGGNWLANTPTTGSQTCSGGTIMDSACPTVNQ